MAIDVQAEALRRKSAGDPRPIALIVAELSAVPQAQAAQAMTPTPGQPVPVGEQVDIQTAAPAPQQVAVPPMTTPFNPVDKARSAAAPKVQQVAETTATDAGVQQAKQQGKPEASMMDRVRTESKAAHEAELAARNKIRETIGVPKELEDIFKKREERYAQQEAEIASDEKKQVWNALAMAGFQMAQSTSPYFLAALSAGMQSGLEGYNAEQAASAEKKARLMDAKESVALDRYKSEKAAENEELANVDAARAASYRDQEAMIRMLQAKMEEEIHPLKKQQYKAQIDQIYNNMRNDNIRVGLAQASFAREGRNAGNPVAKARSAAINSAYDFGRQYAADKLEAAGITMDDPSYGKAFEAAAGEGADMWINTNPNAKAVLGAGATAIKAPPPPPPAPAKKKDTWWNPFD